MWELERGGVWNPWELVTATEVAGYASQASVRNDEKGWWTAYVVSSVLLPSDFSKVWRLSGMKWMNVVVEGAKASLKAPF